MDLYFSTDIDRELEALLFHCITPKGDLTNPIAPGCYRIKTPRGILMTLNHINLSKIGDCVSVLNCLEKSQICTVGRQ